MKVLSVAGYHHTGKTTAACRIIEGLRKRGYTVMSIKDIHSEAFQLDKDDSNSHRHAQAGAQPVFARGLSETGLLWKRQLKLAEMLTHLDADWVVVEGMKSTALPRVICAESVEQLEELVDGSVFALSGKIADNMTEWNGLPVISAINNGDALVDLAIQKVFDVLPQADDACCLACGMSCNEMTAAILRGEKTRADCTQGRSDVRLRIDGQDVHMVPFVKAILRDVIHGVTGNLKGVRPGSIEITIENNGAETS